MLRCLWDIEVQVQGLFFSPKNFLNFWFLVGWKNFPGSVKLALGMYNGGAELPFLAVKKKNFRLLDKKVLIKRWCSKLRTFDSCNVGWIGPVVVLVYENVHFCKENGFRDSPCLRKNHEPCNLMVDGRKWL